MSKRNRLRDRAIPVAVRRFVRGFTMTEVLVTVAIGAVLTSLAAPGFVDMLDKRRLEGPAEALYADMQFARSEALKRGIPVRMVFKRNAADDWCYGMTHNDDCDCNPTVMPTDAEYCYLDINRNNDPTEIGETDPVRKNSSANWQGVEMPVLPYGGNGGKVTFTPPHATATAGNIEYVSDRGKVLRVVTAGIGRVRICSPVGDGKMWAFKDC